MTRTGSVSLLGIIVVLLLAGCGSSEPKTTYSRVGDAAPAFSTDWDSFLAGTWTRGIATNPDMAKQLGIESLDMDSSDDPIDVVYTFEANGKVTLKHGAYVATGTWTGMAESVTMQFDTLNGKAWQTALDDLKKAEEGGTQGAVATGLFTDNFVSEVEAYRSLTLSPDRKKLVAVGGAFGMGRALERIEATTAK